MTRIEAARVMDRVLDIVANVAPNALSWALLHVDCWSRAVVEMGPTAVALTEDWAVEVEPTAREVLWVVTRLMEPGAILQRLTPEERALFRELIE